VRNFGGAWPWTFRILPLDRWSAGLGREEYLRSLHRARTGSPPARRLAPGITLPVLRGALAFATLERLVGWPTLQAALRVLTESAARRSFTRAELEAVMAAAIGQDLSWFFATAFDTTKSFDYGVAGLTTGETSPCGVLPCFRTRVTVVRSGTGEFSGSSNPASSQFDAGDAVELRVQFTDRQSVSARWDGRSESRTFEFESAVPAQSAHLDPDRVLVLDENYLDNTVRLESRTGVPVLKWVAYWLVWLQGAMLDYSSAF
jgi:hypothetical protein